MTVHNLTNIGNGLYHRREDCWRIPRSREDDRQRTATNRTNNLNKEKKERTQNLMWFGNLPTSSGQGREFLLNQSITGYGFQDFRIQIWGHYPSLYSQKNHEEKETKNT